MSAARVFVSLCIPTNGIVEWVIPVLDSIYQDNIREDLFEVIVTDNGNNLEFGNVMKAYVRSHSNLVYQKTEAEGFLNQIEAFKLAEGKFIKFVNHRSRFLSGTLCYLIDYVRENAMVQPVIFFLNGGLRLPKEWNKYTCFDDFVLALSYYSSWSGGIGIWKEALQKMDFGRSFNRLFPHTDILFSDRNNSSYIIDNKHLFEDIPADVTKKGKYDLFFAFAVEYIRILEELYKDGSISKNTFEKVRLKNGKFLAELYFNYVVRKIPCSYDVSGYKTSIDVYYGDWQIKAWLPYVMMKAVLYKIKSLIFSNGRL